MNKEILVDANKFAIRVAVVEDGTPVELYVEQTGTERLVGNIYLDSSASLTLHESVTHVGAIILRGTASLTLPKGVTQVGDIELYGSASLTLPEGVTQVGKAFLRPGTSVIFPDGFVLKGDSGVRIIDAGTMNVLLSDHSPSKKMSKRAQLHEKAEKNFKNVIDKISTNHQIKTSNQIKPK